MDDSGPSARTLIPRLVDLYALITLLAGGSERMCISACGMLEFWSVVALLIDLYNFNRRVYKFL